MRIKIFILYVFIWFLLINWFFIIDFIYNILWNKSFSEQEYKQSKNYYINIDNEFWKYNVLNSDYKLEKYTKLEKWYNELIDCKIDKGLCFKSSFNLANTYFRLWEKENNLEKRLELWKNSIDLYSDVLDIKYDEETEKNLYFITNKLKKLKKEIEKNTEKEKKQDSDNSQKWDNSEKDNKEQDSSDKWEENKENNWKQEWKEQENKKWEEKDWDKSSSESSSSDGKEQEQGQEQNWWSEGELSDYEKAYLEKRQEALDESQKDLWTEYNKQYNENNFDSLEDFLFNDQFFDNRLMNEKDKKDW